MSWCLRTSTNARALRPLSQRTKVDPGAGGGLRYWARVARRVGVEEELVEPFRPRQAGVAKLGGGETPVAEVALGHQPFMVIVNPLVSIILGVWLYGEHFTGGATKIAIGVLGFVAIVIGIVFLAHRTVVRGHPIGVTGRRAMRRCRRGTPRSAWRPWFSMASRLAAWSGGSRGTCSLRLVRPQVSTR
jgi:hypothetical protein